jgi:hypothetical protein
VLMPGPVMMVCGLTDILYQFDGEYNSSF